VDAAMFELESQTRGRNIAWQVGPLPEVDCDPELMESVVANLLSNAVKFTRGRDPAVIQVGQMSSEDQTVIFVRDNGAGFDMQYADRLFGVFQRLHRSDEFEGTGVGLATVQRIIHKHGGRIWAESELGKGATFFWTLPASRSRKAPEGASSKAT
jgi:light-regulated signal transduction histidine kinase (bacteriophytochrome)